MQSSKYIVSFTDPYFASLVAAFTQAARAHKRNRQQLRLTSL